MLTCPRCGAVPQEEFSLVAPNVPCGDAAGERVKVLRHRRCGRFVYVTVEMHTQVH